MMLCLGYWTDELVDLYKIHEQIRTMSIVWDKPFKRKSAKAYQQYKEAISEHRQLKADAGGEKDADASDANADAGTEIDGAVVAKSSSIKPKKKSFRDHFFTLPDWMTPEGGWIETSESLEESEEMMDAQQEQITAAQIDNEEMIINYQGEDADFDNLGMDGDEMY